MTAVPHDLDPTRHDHALEAAMTDRIRTADETAAQRPTVYGDATDYALRVAYRENARLRQERDEAIAEHATAQTELADVRIQRDRLAADYAALIGRHLALGQELDDARQEAIRLGHELHLRDAVAPYAEAEANAAEKRIADLRAQLGAAQDALAAIRHGVEHIDRALAGHDTQQPTAPEPAEQPTAAHRAGYDQAIDNLRNRDRYQDWRAASEHRPHIQMLLGQVADYLVDTYEIPA